jgi:hypothetical protein
MFKSIKEGMTKYNFNYLGKQSMFKIVQNLLFLH